MRGPSKSCSDIQHFEVAHIKSESLVIWDVLVGPLSSVTFFQNVVVLSLTFLNLLNGRKRKMSL